MKLLFDADVYAYRAASAAETEVDWGGDLWSLVADLNESRSRMMADIRGDVQSLGGQMRDVVLCFSDKENWRKWENPDYKKNRKGKRKPTAYKALVDWAFENLAAVAMPGLEADDVMGILATRDPDNTCIVSIDKDMKTIPALLFNPDKDVVARTTTPEEAEEFFWKQAVMGDATDGYGGCPGIGAVGAGKLLAGADPMDAEDCWNRIVGAWQKKLKGEFDMDFAVMNARMARICREGDWDEEKEKMVWMPPQL